MIFSRIFKELISKHLLDNGHLRQALPSVERFHGKHQGGRRESSQMSLLPLKMENRLKLTKLCWHHPHGPPQEKQTSSSSVIQGVFSSEGALYVMMTYYIDIQPLFGDTPVLNNTFEHLYHDDFGD